MARDLNGTSAQITYTLNSSQINTTKESWSFWIYPDSVAQYRRPIHLGGTGGNRDRSYEMDDGWGFVFNFDWSTDGGAWSVAKPSTGAWVNYVVTYDGTSTANDPIIYKNGVRETITERVAPSGSNLRSSQTALYIGSEAGTGQWWDGRIAEVARWNRVLTDTEASQLGIGYTPDLILGGLIFYAPLKGDNDPEIDIIQSNLGTVTNATQITHPTMLYPNVVSKKMYLVQGFQ